MLRNGRINEIFLISIYEILITKIIFRGNLN